MNKFQHKLLSLTIVLALSMFFSHFYLVKQVFEIKETNQRQKLEITVYKDELKRAQQNIQFHSEKNRELRVYTNFLESQNAMLMEKENEVSE